LEKLRFLETANSGPEWCCPGPELTLVFSVWHARKIGARMEEFRARIVASAYFRNVFFGPDLFKFCGRYFYYKYRLCIRVNLKIEGAETRV